MKTYEELRPIDLSWRKIYAPRLEAGEVISKKNLTDKEAKDLDYACSQFIISYIHKAILVEYQSESMPAIYRVEWNGEYVPSTARELFWEASTTYYENFNNLELRALRKLATDVINNQAPLDVSAAFKTRYGRKFLGLFTRYYLDGGPSARDLISVYPALVIAALRLKFKDFDPDKNYSSVELAKFLEATKTREFTNFVLSFIALDDLVFTYILKHARRTDPSPEVATMPDGVPTEIFREFEFANGVIECNSGAFRINPSVLGHLRDLIEKDQTTKYVHRPAHRDVRRGCPFMYVDFNQQFIQFMVNNMSKFVIEHKEILDQSDAKPTE